MQLLLAALAALATLLPAAARHNGRWADAPAAIRQWFQSLMQPDNLSCCGEADAFEADTFEMEGWCCVTFCGPSGRQGHSPNDFRRLVEEEWCLAVPCQPRLNRNGVKLRGA
jgi:hypothetical protein